MAWTARHHPSYTPAVVRRAAVAAVLWASFAGLGAPAAEPAPEPPRLLFVPPADPALARSLTSALSARASLVGPEALPAVPGDPGPARRAAAAVAEAEALYGDARADEAIALLRQALAHDEAALAAAGDLPSLARLWLWQGICLAKTGREADAREAFQAARTLGAPPLDPLRFPPDVLALVPAPGEPVVTEIESQPAGALVEALGATVQHGVTPARFTLAPGRWVVRVGRAGYATVARVVAAGGRIEVPLARATGPALARSLADLRDAGTLDTSDPAHRALIAEALGADGRVDVRLTAGGRVELERFDARGHRVARATGAGRDAETLVAALFPEAEGGGRGGPPGGARGGGSLFGRWWFWASVGVVVAAGVTVGLVLANQEPDTITYRLVP